jgi:glycerol-3-phosphate acyltransferase PlsY
MVAVKLILCALVGYLIGGINPAYVIARIKGFDIRDHGSGNAGASNAVITMGKKVGVFTALFDIVKAFAAVYIARLWIMPTLPMAACVAGTGCIIGHIFPVFMNFRGGKGLACLGGVILALNPMVFVILLAIELVIVLIVDYICIVPMTASVVYPILYGLITKDAAGALTFVLVAAVILYKHMENVKRIRNGTEAHFSYLWKKDKEIERLQDLIDDELLEKQREEK